MLYALLYPLGDTFIGFNVFRYLTFRTGLAIATAFVSASTPNVQKTKLKIKTATATPPRYSGPGRWPATAVSTAPSRGTEIFEMMIGPAISHTRR